MKKVMSIVARVILIGFTGYLSLAAVVSMFSFNENDVPGTLIFVPACIGMFVTSLILITGNRKTARAMQLLAVVGYLSIFLTPGLYRDIALYALETGIMFAAIACLAQVATLGRVSRSADSVNGTAS